MSTDGLSEETESSLETAASGDVRASLEASTLTQPPARREHFGWIMALYLVGLFIGALSTGSITPARVIIQSDLGVDSSTGIWMITIFTLCYAAVIPVAGKLADMYGRKYVYIASVACFGVGSILCGVSETTGSFVLLIVGRIVQARGAGGILPIATAEFGTSFPVEKRGMALGLVGGLFGVGNVLGATFGSAILSVFGADGWSWIFYINVPICLIIVAGSFFLIPNHKGEVKGRVDKLGTLVMVLMILALLYGLKNIDFFDFAHSIIGLDVWPYLVIFIVLIPVFRLVEKHAEDPIFHLEYLSDRQIVITLLISLLVGASMMGMVFIPQFAENALRIPSGSGGYLVLILGVCAGVGSPISGLLIDKFGSKVVLGFGLVISVVGCLYLALVATTWINTLNVVVSLVLIGLGLGFTMGSPLNYMMLRHTSDDESNAALATLSLVRSIGTSIAPAIMVGFIVQATGTLGTTLMQTLPDLPELPAMSQTVRLQEIFGQLEGLDPDNASMFTEASDDLASMSDMGGGSLVDMVGQGSGSSSNGMELPPDMLAELQGADVTTIVGVTKDLASYMFDTNTPAIITMIQEGIQNGIDGIEQGLAGLDAASASMGGNLPGPMVQERDLLSEADTLMTSMRDGIPDMFAEEKEAYLQAIDDDGARIESVFQATLNVGYRGMYICTAAFNIVALLLLFFYRNDRLARRGY